MRFWYMQLHPGGGQDSPEDRESRQEFNSERMLQTLVRYKMIGLGSEEQWDGDRGQIRRFKEEMASGDIVMCAEGANFFALVKVVSDAFYRQEPNEEEEDYRWFGLARNVEVLSTDPTPFERLYDEEHAGEAEKGRKPHYSHCNPRQTLCQWQKNKFIQFWYEHLERIPNELIHLRDEIAAMPETEVIAQSTQRRGQDKIRKVLLETRRRCEVSDLEIPELLRASHIKPWKDSSNAERLDLENVLLLAVNYDAAFDSGLISFNAETGGIIISPTVPLEQLHLLGIDCQATLPKPSGKRAEYLKWHYAHIFKLIL